MEKRYRVEIGYIDFIFEGRYEAIEFADKAFETLDDDRSVSVKIEKIEEESEEEGVINE